MRRPSSMSVSVYLDGVPPDVARQVLAGFMHGHAEVYEFQGPHHFFRMGGWDGHGKPVRDLGAWWIDRDELDVLMARNGLAFSRNLDQRLSATRDLFLQHGEAYRAGVAVSRDWNTGVKAHELRIPPGAAARGLVGSTTPQPVFSPKSPHHDATVLLPGGLTQIFFRARDLGRDWLTGNLYRMVSG